MGNGADPPHLLCRCRMDVDGSGSGALSAPRSGLLPGGQGFVAAVPEDLPKPAFVLQSLGVRLCSGISTGVWPI